VTCCSIVIPACNEEHLIGRALTTMLEGAAPGEFEVVVVANGCHDATAEVARAYAPVVRVVETGVASKSAALDLGDRWATAYPRLFVDADVIVDAAAIRAVAAALAGDEPRAGAPRLEVDLTGRPWTVRAYYRIWGRTAYARSAPLGSGFYGVSAAGRRRFDRFPDLIADDLFVPGLFARHERIVVDGHRFVQPAPRDRTSLVHRRVRAAAGSLQYRRLHGDGELAAVPGIRRLWVDVACRPWLWPAALAYLSVRGQAQRLARRKIRTGALGTWERDESTRQRVPAA
jgi:glycosyltransferase involved in cell wall biosynthesis